MKKNPQNASTQHSARRNFQVHNIQPVGTCQYRICVGNKTQQRLHMKNRYYFLNPGSKGSNRKEGRTDGRTDGREGRKEGGTEGRKEGRKDGREGSDVKEGRKEGRTKGSKQRKPRRRGKEKEAPTTTDNDLQSYSCAQSVAWGTGRKDKGERKDGRKDG
jgi:hypothetical protein